MHHWPNANICYYISWCESPSGRESLKVLGLSDGQTELDQVGAITTLTEYTHDLADVGFDDLTKSIYGQGAWILHEHHSY